MSTTLQTNELTLRTSIIQKINLIFNDEEYTFEAFILMKGNHIFKRISVVTCPFLPILVTDAGLIPAFSHRSFFFISLSISSFQIFL